MLATLLLGALLLQGPASVSTNVSNNVATAVLSADSIPRRDPGRVHNALEGQTRVSMPAPMDASIVIDGKLDEPVWQRAMMLTGFSQYAPADQRPAPDSTEVLVWYSADAIHFGIRAFEPHGEVRATLADRDRIGSDDRVEIHLDTFEERRRAFVFIVNPFGVQADGTKSEGGGFIPGSNVAPGQNDLTADFQWQSRGRVTDWGYEVELRIPFSSLRFPMTDNQRWGIQVVRHVQHSGYELTWTAARRASASFIAQQGWLEGLSGLNQSLSVTLNPELTSTVIGEPALPGAESSWRYRSTPRVGGNVRLGLGSNFVVNGTIRPDFSQVEADATQVAADQRFALFYPERRLFFVEGSDQFNVPNTLVYTRRIVQPDAAAKLNGRIGRTNVAVLSALDVVNTNTGAQHRPFVNIARFTRDFSQQSTAGLLYSDRTGGGRVNRTAGFDVRHVFGLYYAQAQLASSFTSAGGTARSGSLWEAVVDRTGRNWGFHYNVLGIQPNFQTDNGFIARTGFVSATAANRLTWFGNRGARFERFNVFLRGTSLWRYSDLFDGQSPLEAQFNANSSFTFRGGWQISLTPQVSSYAFDPAAFGAVRVTDSVPFVPSPRVTTTSVQFGASTPQLRRFAANINMTTARDVDFIETTRVQREAWNASLDLRPTDRIRVNATYASNLLTRRLDGLSSFSTQVPRLRVEYQVARPIFVRVVSQYEASRREPLVDWRTGQVLLVPGTGGAWVPSVQRRSNVWRTDYLFSYRPRPGTLFFAGYGSTQVEDDALSFRDLRRVNDGFFVKGSYWWQWPH